MVHSVFLKLSLPSPPPRLRNTSQYSFAGVPSDTFLKRGTTYYTNVAVSQDSDWIPDASNTQYYGFTPNSVSISDPSCTTFAREANGGVFPDGISFIIPKIINNDPEIIDSSTVKLKLYLDSSGHTVDVPGTDTLGFFLNHTDNLGADGSCNYQAFSTQTILDVSNILVPEPPATPWNSSPTNRDKGAYHLDASGLKVGQNYYYTGYTAFLNTHTW